MQERPLKLEILNVPNSKSWPTDKIISAILWDLPHSLQANTAKVPWNRSRPTASTPFPTHYWSPIPPAYTKQRLLTASLNNCAHATDGNDARENKDAAISYEGEIYYGDLERSAIQVRLSVLEFLPSETQAHIGKWNARTKRPYDKILYNRQDCIRAEGTLSHCIHSMISMQYCSIRCDLPR